MAKKSFKHRILEAGLQVMLRKGYHGSSVRDVVAAASAPQGSFTNHFRSKEAFAKDVLDLYFEHVRRLIAEALQNASLSPASGCGAISTSSLDCCRPTASSAVA